ncbi:hypothetical protein [Thalassomonas actiniarum]|uniref:hypothetical protein n=1 Tax=Thalassomonas actiniarum TaxID=485447 RepID=UPI0005CE62DE|nr:hypothetical protein [Thalassomonas actiniarum]
MRILCLFLALVLFQAHSKSITILVNAPEGAVGLYEFAPETELEKNAYISSIEYLKSKKKEIYRYYIIKHGLNVNSGIYQFYLQHSASFGNSDKLIINKSYNNGIIHYDVKTNEVIKFERWRQ